MVKMMFEKAARVRKLVQSFTLLTAALLLTPAAWSHWQLNNQLSQLNFVTTKAGSIGEIHQFKSLSGAIDDDGVITVTIDPASVDTLIPIRDERMRSILFKAAQFPRISFSGKLEPDAMNALGVGASATFDITGTLTIREQSISVATTVLATKVNSRGVLVNTLQPILLNAASLGLAEAVEELREIAGLPSISPSVPVTFVLTFSG